MPLCYKAWVSPANIKFGGVSLSAYSEVMESLVQITSSSALKSILDSTACQHLQCSSDSQFLIGEDPLFRSWLQIIAAPTETLHIKLACWKSLIFFLLYFGFFWFKGKTLFQCYLVLHLLWLCHNKKYCLLLTPKIPSQRKLPWVFGTSLRQTFVQFFIHLFFSQLFSVLDKEREASA